jgi:hypothetical protein
MSLLVTLKHAARALKPAPPAAPPVSAESIRDAFPALGIEPEPAVYLRTGSAEGRWHGCSHGALIAAAAGGPAEAHRLIAKAARPGGMGTFSTSFLVARLYGISPMEAKGIEDGFSGFGWLQSGRDYRRGHRIGRRARTLVFHRPPAAAAPETKRGRPSLLRDGRPLKPARPPPALLGDERYKYSR